MLGDIDLSGYLLGLGSVSVPALLIPLVLMRVLVPVLEESGRTVQNYRGRKVVYGLGFAWLSWSAAMALYFTVAPALSRAGIAVVDPASGIGLAVPLVAFGFVFGFIDDTFGTAAEKGFRGHLSALARGRLTTGAVKLVGIGAVALVGGAMIGVRDGLTMAGIAHAVAAAAVIALAANTVNLFDLRPGRALKVSALLIVSAATAAFAVAVAGPAQPLGALLGAALIAIVAAGPVLAVWSYDVRERGMLGDAGANAAGILAGTLLAATLPVAGSMVLAAVLLGLNVASERVSFSAVIERTPWLRSVDEWGRTTGVR